MSKNTVRKQTVNQFAQLPSVSIPRSAFDLSHGYKTTLDAGYLYPILAQEVLPGDSLNLKASMLCRLATPITPFMDNVYLETQFFFIPNRILWQHWVNMMGEREDPDSSTDYICPVDTAPDSTGFAVGGLYDYFGVPTGVPGIEVNALFRRAYYRCWNEWYRAEFLQDSDDDGLETGDSGQKKDFQLKRRNKFHDYFTSANPFPQAGNASSIGLAGNIPVSSAAAGATITPKEELIAMAMNSNYYPGSSATVFESSSNADIIKMYWISNTSEDNSAGNFGSAFLLGNNVDDANQRVVFSGPIVTGSKASVASSVLGPTHDNSYINPPKYSFSNQDNDSFASRRVESTGFKAAITGLTADMSQVGLLDINSIREAFQIQKLLEKDARGGTRYVEQNLVHFGVRSPDARLQRPEYLGGSRTRIYINAVSQTSESGSKTPQGNLAAYGVGSDSFHGFTKSFVEHGIVLGLASIRADLSYQQGLHRQWSRSSRFDYYYPVFAHLGEQAILNKEIYCQGPAVLNENTTPTPVDDDVFGYQERYAEYRYHPSLITGKMRSTFAQSLDIWHLAQEFSELPQLGSEFIEENPPISRVIAVPSEPQFILDVFFQEKAVRPMPVYSVPGLVDHF